MSREWNVQIKGERCGKAWEISVIKSSNLHGQKSWGWFNDTKLLISHNGGPCNWPIIGFVWDEQVKIANALCEKLNSGEIITL